MTTSLVQTIIVIRGVDKVLTETAIETASTATVTVIPVGAAVRATSSSSSSGGVSIVDVHLVATGRWTLGGLDLWDLCI